MVIIRAVCFVFVLLTLSEFGTTESNETVLEVPLQRCAQVNRKTRPHFHLVRRCARSDVRIVITANFSSQWRCSEFAYFKRGLAFNFGWLKGGVGHCEVLECPEHDTMSSLRRIENYDYYSLYANPFPAMDWLCVPKVGMFRIGRGEARSTGRRKCQQWALMATPHNKTDGKNSTDQSGMQTSLATSRPDDRFTQELQPSNLPPTQPPPELPFPPFPPFPFFPFGSPLFPPSPFGGGPMPSPFSPEFRAGETFNSSNGTDAKPPREAGQLANVLSPDRTVNLTTFLLSKIGKHFPPILVGLATVPGDPSVFATPDGEPLPCFRFRAWAPGHPLSAKRFKALIERSSASKPTTHEKTNVTAKANATDTNSTKTTTNGSMNINGTKNESTSVADRKRDQLSLCVYLHGDSLWHTSPCSTKALFLCEILPSGGPCRDANNTDDRTECEYEKIGTLEDRCSAWNGEMITTTMMMPTEPEKGEDDNEDEDNDDDDNNDNNGDEASGDDDNNDDDNETDNNDDDDKDTGNYDYEDNNDDTVVSDNGSDNVATS